MKCNKMSGSMLVLKRYLFRPALRMVEYRLVANGWYDNLPFVYPQ